MLTHNYCPYVIIIRISQAVGAKTTRSMSPVVYWMHGICNAFGHQSSPSTARCRYVLR